MRSCHKKSERGPCNQRGTWRKPEAMQVKMPTPTYRSVVIYHNRAWDTRPVGLLLLRLFLNPPRFRSTKAPPIGGTHPKGTHKLFIKQQTVPIILSERRVFFADWLRAFSPCYGRYENTAPVWGTYNLRAGPISPLPVYLKRGKWTYSP